MYNVHPSRQFSTALLRYGALAYVRMKYRDVFIYRVRRITGSDDFYSYVVYSRYRKVLK